MLLLQLFVDGMASGALYALSAVGFAIIYNGTRILHMAHGAVFTAGGYALYIAVKLLNLPIVVAVIVALSSAAIPDGPFHEVLDVIARILFLPRNAVACASKVTPAEYEGPRDTGMLTYADVF
jgi:branched-subunit amino acid ABC-type transport system permease component